VDAVKPVDLVALVVAISLGELHPVRH